jgi:DNA-binding NarL/FixJ family response regulator
MGSGIRVLCVDDHPIVREGVRAILSRETDLEVVASAASGEEAVQLFQAHTPDVTVMDLKMPGMGGLKALEEIRSKFPQAKIVVLTTYDGDEDVYRAVRAGAATYLLKETLADDLVRVVREVYQGGRPLPQEVAARLAARIGKPSITRREGEVLNLMARGLRNKEIAGELEISEETVQVHVKNILAKLTVHDRTEAVTVALRRGILHSD